MIVYDSTKIDFRNDVKNNLIDKKIYEAFQHQLGHKTSKSEIVSWKNSMMYMSNILDDSDIPDDAGVSIEYMLPRSSKRIDFIVTGLNEEKINSMIIVELKQWQEVEKTDQPMCIFT